MSLQVTKTDVWAGELKDQPGGLAKVLEAVSKGGANLECVIARRSPDKPGQGVVFLAPIKKEAESAARGAGLTPAEVSTLRVEGPDKAGLGAKMMRAIADAKINTRGVTSAMMGGRFVAYLGFDNSADADKAAQAIKGVTA
jgi:hypothetical protein